MKKILASTVLFIFIMASYSIGQINKSSKAELLLLLKAIKGNGILFGHQDDLAYGINWKYVEGESDVKRVAGDYPALYGWELGGIELGQSVNLDSVPFDAMRNFAVKVHQKGGVNTFSWHPYSVIDGVNSWNTKNKVVKYIIEGGSHHQEFKEHLNKLAVFFNSIRTPEGSKVPFIFRPWHEMDGSWFWWGSNSCSAEEFQSLFRFTVEYLRNVKGVDQMIIAYSPDCNFNSGKEYLKWYPGDDYVDIIGMDNYHDLKSEAGVQKAIDKLHMIITIANQKGKVSALTETGVENVKDATWYSEKLGVVLNDSVVSANISYVMVWRNDPDVHFFFPYQGHAGAPYAKSLLDQKHIWLLHDLVKFKNYDK